MIFSGVVNLFIYCRAKKLYLISKIKERELGKHVFQDFLKNNHLQGKKQVSLTYNDHQLWTKHERERDQKSVHCYMYTSIQSRQTANYLSC